MIDAIANFFGSPAASRLGVFFATFVVLATLETLYNQRRAERARWRANLGLGVLGALAPRLVPGAGALAAAAWAHDQGWGLIPLLGLEGLAAACVVIVAMDGIIYWQHRFFHRAPWLWRLHQVHHADPALDVTTALRFHPIEILVSLGIKVCAVVALGAPVEAVILFEIILNASAMFNHANLHLPAPVDKVLRMVVVTPAMHRVHHSTDGADMNHNYGFFLSCWDRLFGSARQTQTAPNIGLTYAPPDQAITLWRTLLMPLAATPATHKPSPSTPK